YKSANPRPRFLLQPASLKTACLDVGGPSLLFPRRNLGCIGLYGLCCPTFPPRCCPDSRSSFDGVYPRRNLPRTADCGSRTSRTLPEYASSIQAAIADVARRLDSRRVLGLRFCCARGTRTHSARLRASADLCSSLDRRRVCNRHRPSSRYLYWCAD